MKTATGKKGKMECTSKLKHFEITLPALYEKRRNSINNVIDACRQTGVRRKLDDVSILRGTRERKVG